MFSPLLSGRELSGDVLAQLWLAGSAFMLVGVVIVLCVRPDPREIARIISSRAGEDVVEGPPAPLRELLRRPASSLPCWGRRRASGSWSGS